MPRRAAPGDAAAILAALPPDVRVFLAAARERFNVHDWQASPLGPVFTHWAVLVLADTLEADGTSPTAALDLASFALGVAPTTSRYRSAHWPDESRRGAMRITRMDSLKNAG